MSERLPYLPLFVDDYEAATSHLSLEEDGTYMRLLRLCWRTPHCSIPEDPAWIMRRLRVDQETYDRVVALVLAEFFKRSRGRFYQRRLREEFEGATKRQKKRKDAGKKGGEAKAKKTKEKESSNATLLPEQKSSKTVASTPPHPIGSIEEPNGSSRAPALPAIPDDAETAFAEWEICRQQLRPTSRSLTLTDVRRSKLTKRLKEIGGLPGWRQMISLVKASPLLRGEKTDWKAELDWLLEPKNLTKVMEGNYDDEGHQLAGGRGRSRLPASPIDAIASIWAGGGPD